MCAVVQLAGRVDFRLFIATEGGIKRGWWGFYALLGRNKWWWLHAVGASPHPTWCVVVRCAVVVLPYRLYIGVVFALLNSHFFVNLDLVLCAAGEDPSLCSG